MLRSSLYWIFVLVLSATAAARQVLPRERVARRSLFAITVINPTLAVWSNDYDARRIKHSFGLVSLPFGQGSGTPTMTGWLPKLISLALRPRVMFSLGALLRALQLTTPMRWIFDPSCGIGAGVNLLCWWSNAEWPAALVLGWVTSPPFWSVLGTDGPTLPAVPIFHANTLPVNLTDPTGPEGSERPLKVDIRLVSPWSSPFSRAIQALDRSNDQ